MDEPDPVGILYSDPEGHLSDILYLYFRVYKKKLLWRFYQEALGRLQLDRSSTLFISDVGAAMGYDVLYLLRRLSQNFRHPLPFAKIHLSLIEGHQEAIALGTRNLKKELLETCVDFQYYSHPLVEGLTLEDQSQHLAICSEVVEHLEEPEKLLREIFRILQPGGFLMFTTDNIPSFLHRLKRIPAWLRGKYATEYARPSKESLTTGRFTWNGKEYSIYGHINVNPTQHWEGLCKQVGFELVSYGTYESVRRGGGSRSPLALVGYFAFGALVYYLMPKSIGRCFGDTTALLLRKPQK